MRATISVQARLGSTRLPGKVMMHLGDRRVVEWVVHRCANASIGAPVYVAAGDRPENAALTELCDRNGYPSVVGPEDDLLARHLRVVDETDCDALVRVTGDCPFVAPDEVDRVVREHERNDARYTTNVTESMPVGAGVDVVDSDVLRELSERGETHPVRLLRDRPESWRVAHTESEDWTALGDVHLAVDTPGDYWRLTDAVAAVGDEPRAVARWLAGR